MLVELYTLIQYHINLYLIACYFKKDIHPVYLVMWLCVVGFQITSHFYPEWYGFEDPLPLPPPPPPPPPPLTVYCFCPSFDQMCLCSYEETCNCSKKMVIFFIFIRNYIQNLKILIKFKIQSSVLYYLIYVFFHNSIYRLKKFFALISYYSLMAIMGPGPGGLLQLPNPGEGNSGSWIFDIDTFTYWYWKLIHACIIVYICNRAYMAYDVYNWPLYKEWYGYLELSQDVFFKGCYELLGLSNAVKIQFSKPIYGLEIFSDMTAVNVYFTDPNIRMLSFKILEKFFHLPSVYMNLVNPFNTEFICFTSTSKTDPTGSMVERIIIESQNDSLTMNSLRFHFNIDRTLLSYKSQTPGSEFNSVRFVQLYFTVKNMFSYSWQCENNQVLFWLFDQPNRIEIFRNLKTFHIYQTENTFFKYLPYNTTIYTPATFPTNIVPFKMEGLHVTKIRVLQSLQSVRFYTNTEYLANNVWLTYFDPRLWFQLVSMNDSILNWYLVWGKPKPDTGFDLDDFSYLFSIEMTWFCLFGFVFKKFSGLSFFRQKIVQMCKNNVIFVKKNKLDKVCTCTTFRSVSLSGMVQKGFVHTKVNTNSVSPKFLKKKRLILPNSGINFKLLQNFQNKKFLFNFKNSKLFYDMSLQVRYCLLYDPYFLTTNPEYTDIATMRYRLFMSGYHNILVEEYKKNIPRDYFLNQAPVLNHEPGDLDDLTWFYAEYPDRMDVWLRFSVMDRLAVLQKIIEKAGINNDDIVDLFVREYSSLSARSKAIFLKRLKYITGIAFKAKLLRLEREQEDKVDIRDRRVYNWYSHPCWWWFQIDTRGNWLEYRNKGMGPEDPDIWWFEEWPLRDNTSQCEWFDFFEEHDFMNDSTELFITNFGEMWIELDIPFSLTYFDSSEDDDVAWDTELLKLWFSQRNVWVSKWPWALIYDGLDLKEMGGWVCLLVSLRRFLKN